MYCAVLSFVGSTGSTTISFILPGLFYWQVRFVSTGVVSACANGNNAQLTRADRNRNNVLSLGALALAAYGVCVFVFWYVFPPCGKPLFTYSRVRLQPHLQHLPSHPSCGGWTGAFPVVEVYLIVVYSVVCSAVMWRIYMFLCNLYVRNMVAAAAVWHLHLLFPTTENVRGFQLRTLA